MADTLAVMTDGAVLQQGAPEAVYREPATRFVAGFLGQMNFIPGTGRADAAGAWTVRTAMGDLRCQRAPGLGPGDAVVVAIRPEEIELVAGPAARPATDAAATDLTTNGATVISARVLSRLFLGDAALCRVIAADQIELVVKTPASLALAPGAAVALRLPAAACRALPAEAAPALA